MNAERVAGVVLTVLGAVGYVVGVAAPYPGRAFSLTGVMVGLTLLAIGSGEDDQ
ncbi:hypothetical protein [Halogranum rubrum]|uniref:Uncharacterized protein n=1 Tax=Halogranum salarium B-1 TaxID=1210908 RepID=J3JHJ5_9EURY|nr:hypothetical protein [Halogranum salarium]EJN61036.1 hypothetical protein HSB1_00770 [Halogranum salarium B-1]